jgi:hypothetical protein
MKYIDERPFEQIVRERTLSDKYVSRIEELLEDISIDQASGFKLYKNTSKHTLYDKDLDLWTAQKKKIEEEMKKEEDLFEKYCKKFEELGEVAALDDSDDDEEEEDYAEELIHEKKEKPLQRNINVKNTQTQRQTQAKERAALVKTLKTSMATSQQKLIDNQKKIEELDVKIKYYTHYQYATQKYIGAMRNLILLYERNQDKEFLRKGLDFILDYTDMLMKRYVSPKSCTGEINSLCESHYLPLHLENNCVKCM